MAMNLFGARDTLTTHSGQKLYFYNLNKFADQGHDISKLPVSIKVLLESVLREANDYDVRREDVTTVAGWKPVNEEVEIPFKPARVILQDFTGVPAVVDLAAMRSAMVAHGRRPQQDQPADSGGSGHRPLGAGRRVRHRVRAREQHRAIEFERNRERYEFLRWGQQAFDNFRVVPPAIGHRAPGQPGVPRQGCAEPPRGRRRGRVPRHAWSAPTRTPP